jgi:hypothetical protein
MPFLKRLKKKTPTPRKPTPLRAATKKLDFSGSCYHEELHLPIKVKTSRGVEIAVLGRGSEVVQPITQVSGKVTKRYAWRNKLNEGEWRARFSWLKELLKLEPKAPIVEPLSFAVINTGKEKQIVWREKSAGIPITRLSSARIGKNEHQRILKKYDEAKKELHELAERHDYFVGDTKPTHAIYDSKRDRIMFTDLVIFKRTSTRTKKDA